MAESSLEKYIRMLRGLGFEKALEIAFSMPGERNEKFLVFYHKRDAILLTFDTHLGSQHNGNIYYNWRARVPDKVYKQPPFISGHWSERGKRDVFVGRHFLPRSNLRAVLNRFRKSGAFVSPWVEKPHISLTHYGDPILEHERIHAERVMKLPARVRKMFLL